MSRNQAPPQRPRDTPVSRTLRHLQILIEDADKERVAAKATREGSHAEAYYQGLGEGYRKASELIVEYCLKEQP